MTNHALAEIPETTVGGRGTGRGGDFSGGEGQGSGLCSARPAIPQRTYITEMAIALGAILMFFIALVSAWIVRKGLAYGDSQPLDIALAPAVAEYGDFARKQFHSAAFPQANSRARRSRFPPLVGRQQYFWAYFFWPGSCSYGGSSSRRDCISRQIPTAAFSMFSRLRTGLHLLGGIAALAAAAFYLPGPQAHPRHRHKVAAMYWHSMDALWLGMFLLFWFGFRA